MRRNEFKFVFVLYKLVHKFHSCFISLLMGVIKWCKKFFVALMTIVQKKFVPNDAFSWKLA